MRIKFILLSLTALVILGSCTRFENNLVLDPPSMKVTISGVEFFYETVNSQREEVSVLFGINSDNLVDYSILLDDELILSPLTDNPQTRTFTTIGEHRVKYEANYSSQEEIQTNSSTEVIFRIKKRY